MKQVIEEKKSQKHLTLQYNQQKSFCPSVITLQKKQKNKLEIRIKNIHSFTLTSESTFSILSFIHTLWH